jgi:hypothetical protein
VQSAVGPHSFVALAVLLPPRVARFSDERLQRTCGDGATLTRYPARRTCHHLGR